MIVQAFMHTSCYGGKAWFELNNFVAETNLCVLIQHGPYNGASVFVCISIPEDIPRNINIVAEGRAAGLELHPRDTVMLLKRYAADEMLVQDGGSKHHDTDKLLQLFPTHRCCVGRSPCCAFPIDMYGFWERFRTHPDLSSASSSPRKLTTWPCRNSYSRRLRVQARLGA